MVVQRNVLIFFNKVKFIVQNTSELEGTPGDPSCHYSAVHLSDKDPTAGVGGGVFHSGMLACFFQGFSCFLLASTSRSLQILLRVVEGSMMSSTNPETHKLACQKKRRGAHHFCFLMPRRRRPPLRAAGKGLANFSTYSASASAWFSFPLKMICTAP